MTKYISQVLAGFCFLFLKHMTFRPLFIFWDGPMAEKTISLRGAVGEDHESCLIPAMNFSLPDVSEMIGFKWLQCA